MNRGIYSTTFDEDVPTTNTDDGCPECGGRVVTNSHETVCEACGLVIGTDSIDTRPAWGPTDDDEDNQKRTGAPLTAARHDRGLSTQLGRSGTDARGRQLSAKKQRQVARLRREQRRAKIGSKRERNQVYAITDIRRMVSALGLGTTLRDQACELFRTAQRGNLLRGRSIEAMSAAAVYAACRVAGQPQTLADIAPVARVERARIENAYGVLNRELNLPAKPPEPAEFVPRLVSELGLPAAVERRARTLLDDRGAGGGSSPSGVAGGAVLVAAADCGERARFAQTDVAEAAGVTTSTLRTHRDALRRD